LTDQCSRTVGLWQSGLQPSPVTQPVVDLTLVSFVFPTPQECTNWLQTKGLKLHVLGLSHPGLGAVLFSIGLGHFYKDRTVWVLASV
jgi:hypothetical protein